MALLVNCHVAFLMNKNIIMYQCALYLFCIVYLAPVALGTKHAPDEVFTVCAEGGLVEECADERVAIVIINLLMNCILSLHLSID